MKISVYVTEKIGLPKFSNVEIHFGVEREVPDGDAREPMREAFNECEEMLAEQRAKVLAFIRAADVKE